MSIWGFYGRQAELEQLSRILSRGRWFFARVTGRRRIGKTTLVQKALEATKRQLIFYVQIPDSEAAGVLSAVRDALQNFRIPARFPPPVSLSEFARLLGDLARAGYVVAVDEFQYFNRERLHEFSSHLQTEVDRLSAAADRVPGGLFVLGSLHTDISALLDDRRAPLYNRVTDEIDLGHLDVSSILEILRVHGEPSPERLLFLWNLFEGVPKFYRDCFEQEILDAKRADFLRRVFFESASPLRYEADNWFLKELHGRYDVVLKFVARNPGCSHGDLLDHMKQMHPESQGKQVGGYLKILTERYRMIEARLPIFAEPTARRRRYYLTDNFLRSWLAALASPVASVNFRPVDELVGRADSLLQVAEGPGFERLIAVLHQERSRKGLPGFRLTRRLTGWWDRGDVEIDLVALDEEDQRIRFGACRRSADKLRPALKAFDAHVERFLKAFPKYGAWKTERAVFAPAIPGELKRPLASQGYLANDLVDLTREL